MNYIIENDINFFDQLKSEINNNNNNNNNNNTVDEI